MVKYDEELVEAFVTALSNSFTSLKKTHNEQFYYYVFIFDAGLHPYISAWSYEALEKSIAENEITDEDKTWWKWSSLESPYAIYGYDDFFIEVNRLLDERKKGLPSLDELYGEEWKIRISSMEEAMKKLDRTGFFGAGDERANVVINVETAPPDESEYYSALRLNPESSLLSEYLKYCEQPGSD